MHTLPILLEDHRHRHSPPTITLTATAERCVWFQAQAPRVSRNPPSQPRATGSSPDNGRTHGSGGQRHFPADLIVHDANTGSTETMRSQLSHCTTVHRYPRAENILRGFTQSQSQKQGMELLLPTPQTQNTTTTTPLRIRSTERRTSGAPPDQYLRGNCRTNCQRDLHRRHRTADTRPALLDAPVKNSKKKSSRNRSKQTSKETYIH